jgi:hypothetical protein
LTSNPPLGKKIHRKSHPFQCPPRRKMTFPITADFRLVCSEDDKIKSRGCALLFWPIRRILFSYSSEPSEETIQKSDENHSILWLLKTALIGDLVVLDPVYIKIFLRKSLRNSLNFQCQSLHSTQLCLAQFCSRSFSIDSFLELSSPSLLQDRWSPFWASCSSTMVIPWIFIEEWIISQFVQSPLLILNPVRYHKPTYYPCQQFCKHNDRLVHVWKLSSAKMLSTFAQSDSQTFQIYNFGVPSFMMVKLQRMKLCNRWFTTRCFWGTHELVFVTDPNLIRSCHCVTFWIQSEKRNFFREILLFWIEPSTNWMLGCFSREGFLERPMRQTNHWRLFRHPMNRMILTVTLDGTKFVFDRLTGWEHEKLFRLETGRLLSFNFFWWRSIAFHEALSQNCYAVNLIFLLDLFRFAFLFNLSDCAFPSSFQSRRWFSDSPSVRWTIHPG